LRIWNTVFLLCVLSISLSVAPVFIANYSVAPSLHAVLSVALTIMHFDGTSILSLHNIDPKSMRQLGSHGPGFCFFWHFQAHLSKGPGQAQQIEILKEGNEVTFQARIMETQKLCVTRTSTYHFQGVELILHIPLLSLTPYFSRSQLVNRL